MPKKSTKSSKSSQSPKGTPPVSSPILSSEQSLQDDTPLGKDGLQIAGVGIRLMAVLYDGMLLLALLFLVSVVLVSVGTVAFGTVGSASADAKELPIWYQNAVLSPSFVLTLVGFYGLFWKKSGQTLGMQTWRLQTLTSDGKLLSWTQSFVRILCACLAPMVCAGVGFLLYGSRMAVLFSGLLGFLLNYLFCYIQPKGLAVQDLLSNTLTVRTPKHTHKGIFFGRK